MRKSITMSIVLMVVSSIVMATGREDDNNKPSQSLFDQHQAQQQQQRITNENNIKNIVGVRTVATSVANPVATALGGVASSGVSNNPVVSSSGQGTGGASQAESGGSGGNVLSSTYNQVKQSPMAWSPNMAMSYSSDNCNNSTTFGVSAGFGAFSGGAPINDDDCTRRRDATLWANLGQMRVACERMLMDEDNAAAMQKAGLTCISITQPLSTPVPPVTVVPKPVIDWDAMARQRDRAFAKSKR